MARRGRRGRSRERAGIGDLPIAFVEKMKGLLGEESDSFLSGLEEEVVGLRVNTLRASPARAMEVIPFPLEPMGYPEEGFRIAAGTPAGKHPYHAAGLYYIQDPSAMVVGALMNPLPGERVADLAAAPGGKSTHLAAKMGDSGFLLANDIHPTRARELAGNLERFGVRNAAVTVESVDRLSARLPGFFDRVLLDAPCSGEAMFFKSEAARSDWDVGSVDGCARRQEELLSRAAVMVRPGGLLVYSTCTFSPEEDERVIACFIRESGDFTIEESFRPPGASSGRPDWVEPELPGLSRTVRLWPHRFAGAGHFIALLRRAPGDATADPPRMEPRTVATDVPDFDIFREEHLAHGVEFGELTLRGAELFALPRHAPSLEGLRVLRPGWWLGTLQRGRFEPAHALAMSLRPGDARDEISLSPSDQRTAAFLRGETIRSEGRPGWLRVLVDGFPLGWGKRVGATVKNHLPKGLRAMS
jgi:16S rRNA C967 or C1407 C5-methylase (RsmB/RsmF family)/NOL1/NOP2/fmu family ribosome biogenesis protein